MARVPGGQPPLPDSPSPQPEWAPGPLLKRHERTKPPLGWPRETDSLCPRCVIETRDGDSAEASATLAELVDGHVGEIKAHIVEENGQLVIRKKCQRARRFRGSALDRPRVQPHHRDALSRARLRTIGDELVHRHGTSSIKYGRGAVLTVDLTNRCNMMCNPCFMDANQVGYVHELTLDEIKAILDASISFKPRRQMTVQFSGGEPTLSPHFLEACRYAKKVGYFNVQAATNGLRFALEPEFASRAKEAGFDLAYFQFDGVTNDGEQPPAHLESIRRQAEGHRSDARRRDRHHPGDHRRQWRERRLRWAHPRLRDRQLRRSSTESRSSRSRSPAATRRSPTKSGVPGATRSRTWRTRSPGTRAARSTPTGTGTRWAQWASFGALADHLRSLNGPDGDSFGAVNCSCHPNCGSSVLLVGEPQDASSGRRLRSSSTSAGFMRRHRRSSATRREGKELTIAQVALSFVRNYDATKAPPGFTLAEFAKLFFNGKMRGAMGKEMHEQDWTILWVGGMWFQDLWTYDFRRTEMCVIPYATQEGEISFCAYNTGVGWRQIVENMHAVATTKDGSRPAGATRSTPATRRCRPARSSTIRRRSCPSSGRSRRFQPARTSRTVGTDTAS